MDIIITEAAVNRLYSCLGDRIGPIKSDMTIYLRELKTESRARVEERYLSLHLSKPAYFSIGWLL